MRRKQWIFPCSERYEYTFFFIKSLCLCRDMKATKWNSLGAISHSICGTLFIININKMNKFFIIAELVFLMLYVNFKAYTQTIICIGTIPMSFKNLECYITIH